MSGSEYRTHYSSEEIRNFIDFMRMATGTRNIEFQPRPTRALYAQTSANPDNCTVRTRCDFSVTPTVLVNHHWEIEELVFTRERVAGLPAVTVVDVGANIGLFSRQVLGWCPNIGRLFAYEPEPENFACLQHNLSCFHHVVAAMAALSVEDGTATLHLDLRNCGNNSLVSGQLGGGWDTSATNVVTCDIVRESRRWLEPGLPIFYKSDTQGYDEFLVTQLPADVCNALIGGISEIERIDKPDFAVERFRAFLDLFQHKAILVENGAMMPVTTDQIVNPPAQISRRTTNIGFWR